MKNLPLKLQLFCLLISCIGSVGRAQETGIRSNIDWDNERHSWKAMWITDPLADRNDYGVFLFRKSFQMEKLPEKAILYISADNSYRLYVNGSYAASGPAKSDLSNWNYDEINIAAFLRTGENFLAVRVVNMGEYRSVSRFSYETALIVQGGEGLEDMADSGQPGWMVKKSDAFKAIPVTRQMLGNKFYAAGPCDSIFAGKYENGWETGKSGDNGWNPALSLRKGVGRGYMHGVPHLLVPSTLPQMTDSLTRFSRIARADNDRLEDHFIKGNGDLKIPSFSKLTILLDQEHLTAGLPEMVVSGGKGSVIKVTYAEALTGPDGRKGNRNEISSGQMIGYYDVFIPDGRKNMVFSPLSLRTYRYVQLEIKAGEEDLYIHDYYGKFTMYPFKLVAGFETGSEFLSSIWETGWRTARLCAHETYMDCPYWEQLQYLGDTRIQALVSLYNSGDDRLMVNALRLADQSRIPEGLTLGRGPSSIPQVSPPFSLIWVDMIHDYYMHRENRELLEELSPGIKAVLGWFERRLASNGLLGPLDWFNFTDWTKGFNVGVPAGVDTGYSCLISLNFAYALDRASEIFSCLGEDYYSRHYAELSASVKKSAWELCYDQQRGLLADTPARNIFSQHTNIFGILTDAIPKKKQQEVMKKILNDPGLIQTTIYFRFYLFNALRHCGMGELYLGQLGPWKEMLNKGLTTWEEGDYDERSDCHAWGSSPNYHFLSLVCGINPGAPGFAKIDIEPALGTLEKVDAKMPHPEGIIRMKLEKDGENGLRAEIFLPGKAVGEFRWKGNAIQLKSGKQVLNLKPLKQKNT